MRLLLIDTGRTAVEPGGRICAQQFPLPGDDQADQDHERQCQDRESVRQVHHIGLGGGQDPDDLETDFSSAIHRERVISELVITAARKTVARTSRMMSLVRRVSGCSKLPETVMSRPSTRMFQDPSRSLGSGRAVSGPPTT